MTDHLTEAQLNEYLDDELDDRAAAGAHLATCADCTARLTALQALFTEIESLPDSALARDLEWRAAPLARTSNRAGVLPRWLTLTAGLQTVMAVIAIALTAPFLVDLASSSSMPVLQLPTLGGILLEAQSQWTTALDMLSRLHMPALPEMPLALDLSGLYFMLIMAGTAIFWLVGNGILLRNQIK